MRIRPARISFGIMFMMIKHSPRRKEIEPRTDRFYDPKNLFRLNANILLILRKSSRLMNVQSSWPDIL